MSDLELYLDAKKAYDSGPESFSAFLDLHESNRQVILEMLEVNTLVDDNTTSAPDIVLEMTHGIYEHYLSHLYKEFGKKEDVVDKIRVNIDSTRQRMGGRNDSLPRPGYGLVIGRIQSGKTAHMFGLALSSIDREILENPFDTVIILSGLTNDLRLQTRDRISKSLKGFHSAPPILPPRDVDLMESDDANTKTAISDHIDAPKSPLFIVIKKNHRVLSHLLEAIDECQKLSLKKRRVLIIDDEADHASIDTNETVHEEEEEEEVIDDDPTATNRLLRLIIKRFNKAKKCWYVGYTATPFANLLIHKGMNEMGHGDYGLNLHPRDFLHALPKPSDHLDNEDYFLTPGTRNVVEITHPVEKSEEEEVFMQDILIRHIITQMIKRNMGMTGFHHTTMVHTSRICDDHKRIAELIRRERGKLSNSAYLNHNSERMRRILKEYQQDVSNETFTEIEDHLDLNEKENLRKFRGLLDTINIVEVNSRTRSPDEDSSSDLDYSHPRSYVAVGGTRLSRGLTLNGLTTSYFTRTSKKPRYDTMLQMARWCGYRLHFQSSGKDRLNKEIDYSGLVRIITTNPIREYFRDIAGEERNLRRKIELLPWDANPEEEIIWIRQHPGMHITAPEKMRDVSWREYGGLQKTAFWSYDSPILQGDARQHSANLFLSTRDLISDSLLVGERTELTSWCLVQGVPSDCIRNFLNYYESILEKSCETRKDIKKLKENWPTKDWNLGIHLPGNRENKTNVLDLDIGLVNRSRGGNGKFKIVQSKASDPYIDLEKDGESERMTPLMLLYMIDPASNQNNDVSGGRVFEKGITLPIPAFGIAVPPEMISQGGVEATAGGAVFEI